MSRLFNTLRFVILIMTSSVCSNSLASNNDSCPSISDAAVEARFESENVTENIWRVLGPIGSFYIEEKRELCLFTLSANMSSFLSDLNEASKVWSRFDVRYGTFYSRNGEIYLEQIVVLPYGSSQTFAETMKFFHTIVRLVAEEATEQKL